MASTVHEIERLLRDELDAVHVEIRDDSARHAGHPGATSGGGHFEVLVVSARFEGLSRIAQHRLVHEALRGLFGAEIHALGLRTVPASRWGEDHRG